MNPLLKSKLPITEEPKKTGKLYFINKKEIKKNLSKSIRDLAAAMPYSSFTNEILDQCNLLLETKKRKKKCESCGLVFSLKSWKECPMCKPSPQPEIEQSNLPSEIEISSIEAVYYLEHKLNEVIDQLNKITKIK